MSRPTLFTWMLLSLVAVCAGGARAQHVPSSVPGIMVLPGWDAEVFADMDDMGNALMPIQLAVESDGDILASSNFRVVPSFDSPVFRFSSKGKLIQASDQIRDPDGICVDPNGRILVGGGRQITLVNSLDGGTDTVFTPGFTNLNWITSNSKGTFYVSENTGEIFTVDSAGNVGPEVYYGTLLPWRVTAIGPPDPMDGEEKLFLMYKKGTELELLKVDPDSTAMAPDITSVAKWSNDEAGGGIAFDSDGTIFCVIQPLGEPSKIVTIDSKGVERDFAIGVRGSGLAFDADGGLLIADASFEERIVRVFPVVGEFGMGCPGDAGVPHLGAAAGSQPFVGQTFSTELTSLPATTNMFVLGLIGFDKHSWLGFDLPLGLGIIGWPGCTLYVRPDINVGIAPNPSTIQWDIPIPGNLPALQGCRFYLQGGIIDFVPGHILLSSTNALTGVIR